MAAALARFIWSDFTKGSTFATTDGLFEPLVILNSLNVSFTRLCTLNTVDHFVLNSLINAADLCILILHVIALFCILYTIVSSAV